MSRAVTEAPVCAIPLAQRVRLLGNVPAFARLPAQALQELAALCREERHARGGIVVAEGETGDRLCLIVQGRAEVTMQGPIGPVTLATLTRWHELGSRSSSQAATPISRHTSATIPK